MKKLIAFLLLIAFSGVGYGYYYTTYKPCYETYGMNSIENFDGTCGCRQGYVWGKNFLGDTVCVNADESCRDQFGFGAKSSGNGYCSCMDGYVWGVDTFGKKKCVDELSEKHSACIKISNSEFDFYTKTCRCKEGYTVKKDTFGDEKCVEKQWTVYFFLKELKGDKAIVYSDYEKKSYEIEVGLCPFIDNYLEKNLIINIGTDKKFNHGDYVVLQNHDKSCKIWSIEEVENDFTFKTCVEIYGDNAMSYGKNQCICKPGYERNWTKDKCIDKIPFTKELGPTQGIGLGQSDWEKAATALGTKKKMLEDIAKTIKGKDTLTQDKIRYIIEGFKLSSDEYTRNVGFYLSYLLE